MSESQADPCQAYVNAVAAAQAGVDAANAVLLAAQSALALCRACNPQPAPAPVEGSDNGDES